MVKPRATRKKRLDYTEGLSWGLRRELLVGRGYEFAGTFPDLDTMKEAWEQNRDSLREEWASNNPPGTRCFAEWLFEIIPRYGERRTTKFWEPLAPYRENHLTHGILHTNHWPCSQESQAEFLDRHNLLTDEEREALGEVVSLEQLHQQELDEWDKDHPPVTPVREAEPW